MVEEEKPEEKEEEKPKEEEETEFQKLKTSNDKFEKELVRGRELKAESQKLEAEKMLGGTAGGHVDSKPADESNHDYRKRVEKELAEGKTEFDN